MSLKHHNKRLGKSNLAARVTKKHNTKILKTKKVMSGGGWFYPYNYEEVSRYYAEKVVSSIIPDNKDPKTKEYTTTIQRLLYDYIEAILIRLYKLHRQEKFSIVSSSGITEITIKDIFDVPVKKSNQKTTYDKPSYLNTDTKKDKNTTRNTKIEFIPATQFFNILSKIDYSYLSRSTDIIDLNTIITYVSQRQHSYYSTDSNNYLNPITYKSAKDMLSTIFPRVTNGTIEYKSIPHMLAKVKSALDNRIRRANNPKGVPKNNTYKQDFKDIIKYLKSKQNIEDIATALFYASMYKYFKKLDTITPETYNTNSSSYQQQGFYGYRY